MVCIRHNYILPITVCTACIYYFLLKLKLSHMFKNFSGKYRLILLKIHINLCQQLEISSKSFT